MQHTVRLEELSSDEYLGKPICGRPADIGSLILRKALSLLAPRAIHFSER